VELALNAAPDLGYTVAMKLYSGPLSLFSSKVRIALDEKRLPYERIDVAFSRGEGYSPKLPEVLAANPKAQVPILIDGALTVYDSTIILEYLEDRYPEPRLYPKDPADRARCRQAEAASDEILFPHVWALIQEIFYKPEAQRDADKIRSARAGIAAIQRELDALLAGSAYLIGDFSVADIAYFVTNLIGTSLGAAPDPALANLQAWLARVAARPSVRTEIAWLAGAQAKL
jgi:glutathione S-transferase